jgi:hypothetical protein
MGGRRTKSVESGARAGNAAVVVSAWAGVVLVAGGVAGLFYLAPAVRLLWAILIVFGVTAAPMVVMTRRRDRAPRRRPGR